MPDVPSVALVHCIDHTVLYTSIVYFHTKCVNCYCFRWQNQLKTMTYFSLSHLLLTKTEPAQIWYRNKPVLLSDLKYHIFINIIKNVIYLHAYVNYKINILFIHAHIFCWKDVCKMLVDEQSCSSTKLLMIVFYICDCEHRIFYFITISQKDFIFLFIIFTKWNLFYLCES